MSEKQLYWQKDGYVPTDEDLCQEWENENADYFNMHRKAIEEFLERERMADDCGEFIDFDSSLNLFIRACEEASEVSDFAAKLVDWIDDSQDFREELARSEVATTPDVIQFVDSIIDCDSPEWNTVVSEAANLSYAEKQVNELIEEVKYLRGLLDDNGISYTTKLSKNMYYPGLYLINYSR